MPVPRASKRGWTAEEDTQLISLVHEYGPSQWGVIAARIEGRNCKSCRLRWRNHLDPQVDSSPFTTDEDEVIVQGQKEYGNRWSVIARLLPGRTDNAVKNRFNTALLKGPPADGGWTRASRRSRRRNREEDEEEVEEEEEKEEAGLKARPSKRRRKGDGACSASSALQKENARPAMGLDLPLQHQLVLGAEAAKLAPAQQPLTDRARCDAAGALGPVAGSSAGQQQQQEHVSPASAPHCPDLHGYCIFPALAWEPEGTFDASALAAYAAFLPYPSC